jgi:uncharacterized membrane protein YjgN (DUF898 family)
MMDRLGNSGEGSRTLPIRFVGSGSEYFRIWIVNLLLTLLTVGLYYPFAKVRRLRYFHGCTEVDGHPLEFHGKPWAMLRGYALVAQLALVYGFAQRSSPLAAGIALLILMAIGPALWHSSLRFRLANTAWRGIRLRFAGTLGGAYAAVGPAYLLALGFMLLAWTAGTGATRGKEPPLLLSLTPLLIVLATPWLLWRAKRYQHVHYEYASERSSFSARVPQVYGVFLRTVLLSMALGAVVAVVVGLGAPGLFALGGLGELGKPKPGTVIVYSLLIVLAALLFQVLLRSYFTARLQDLVWGHTASRRLRFASRLRARSLAGVTARNWLLMVLTLGLFYPFAAVATARLRLQAVSIDADADIDDLVARRSGGPAEAAGDAAADVLGVDIGL